MSLLPNVSKSLARLSGFLGALGPFGLFAVALLDSAFVPLPTGVDVLMIYLSRQQPRMMVVFALLATAGSTVGCVFLYYVSRRAGYRALNKFSAERQARVKNWIDRYDVLSVLIASLMPPPFPFKLFVITAGVFRFSLIRFTLAIIGGRLFRFLLEGYFAIRYGEQAEQLLKRYYPWIGLGLVVLIVGVFVLRKVWKQKAEEIMPGEFTVPELVAEELAASRESDRH